MQWPQASCSGLTFGFGKRPLRLTQFGGVKKHLTLQPEQVRMQRRVGRGMRECAPEPAAGFLQEAASKPEVTERSNQPRADIHARGQRPVQRGAEIVMLACEELKLVFSLGKAQECDRVPRSRPIGGPGVIQPVGRVLTDSREQPVACPAAGR